MEKAKITAQDVLIILDPGHGGMLGARYVTAPAKMFAHKDGPTIYEGKWNREIVAKLKYLLTRERIKFVETVSDFKDVPLPERVEFANKKAKAFNGRAIYVSIHANAGGGNGFEVYTSPGETKSDLIADIWVEEMEKEFPKRVSRTDFSDGDADKEARFFVLTQTTCPAILTESFFMDNLEDAAYMLTNEAQRRVAEVHLKTILRAIEEVYVNPKEVKKETPKPKRKRTVKKK